MYLQFPFVLHFKWKFNNSCVVYLFFTSFATGVIPLFTKTSLSQYSIFKKFLLSCTIFVYLLPQEQGKDQSQTTDQKKFLHVWVSKTMMMTWFVMSVKYIKLMLLCSVLLDSKWLPVILSFRHNNFYVTTSMNEKLCVVSNTRNNNTFQTHASIIRQTIYIFYVSFQHQIPLTYHVNYSSGPHYLLLLWLWYFNDFISRTIQYFKIHVVKHYNK